MSNLAPFPKYGEKVVENRPAPPVFCDPLGVIYFEFYHYNIFGVRELVTVRH